MQPELNKRYFALIPGEYSVVTVSVLEVTSATVLLSTENSFGLHLERRYATKQVDFLEEASYAAAQ